MEVKSEDHVGGDVWEVLLEAMVEHITKTRVARALKQGMLQCFYNIRYRLTSAARLGLVWEYPGYFYHSC